MLSGSIVVLAGAIMVATASFGDRNMNHPLNMFGAVVGLLGFALIGCGWRESK